MPYLLQSSDLRHSSSRSLTGPDSRGHFHSRIFPSILALSTALAWPGAALANSWTGNISSNWFTSGNWNPLSVPGPTNDVSIDIGPVGPAPIINGAGANGAVKNITVGNVVKGGLTLSNAGTLSSALGIIGNNAGSNGQVIVNGSGSAWSNASRITVGAFGAGSLSIINGGVANSGGGTLGFLTGSSGAVTVYGTNSHWSSNSDLFIGEGGTGELTIAYDGSVAAPVVALAHALGSTGTLNIGSAAGKAAAGPGTLSTPIVQFGVGVGTLNFNHTDISGNYIFDAAINGAGTLNHHAGWTNLTGNSSFTGLTHVNGGRLAVNGSLINSQVDVNNGGILSGNGSVGNTLVNAGGTIAPGSSIGTLNVIGNLTFSPNSIYEAETNSFGLADKVIVSGAATLNGGTVQVISGTGKGGNYAQYNSYIILTAAGAVTGKFAGVTSNLAYLDPALRYDSNNVYLSLTRNKTSFSSVANNASQRVIGSAVENLGNDSPLNQAVLTLSVEQSRAAFDQLSGEMHASVRSVQVEDSHWTRDAALERLRGFDRWNAAAATPTPDRRSGLAGNSELVYWGRGIGARGHIEGDSNVASVKRNTTGFVIGGDRMVGDAWRVGLLGGYTHSGLGIEARNASVSSNNHHVGAYAGGRWGALGLRTGLGYSWHDVTTRRDVAFPGFTDKLQADYRAGTSQVFGELGWRILSGATELEPFASLAHVNVTTGGFAERGGAAALGGTAASSSVTFSTLGLRASSPVVLEGGMALAARGSLGWRHAFGGAMPASSLTFAGGAPFAMAGVPVAKNVAAVEVGLDFRLTPAITLGVSYGGEFGSGLRSQMGHANLNVKF